VDECKPLVSGSGRMRVGGSGGRVGTRTGAPDTTHRRRHSQLQQLLEAILLQVYPST